MYSNIVPRCWHIPIDNRILHQGYHQLQTFLFTCKHNKIILKNMQRKNPKVFQHLTTLPVCQSLKNLTDEFHKQLEWTALLISSGKIPIPEQHLHKFTILEKFFPSSLWHYRVYHWNNITFRMAGNLHDFISWIAHILSAIWQIICDFSILFCILFSFVVQIDSTAHFCSSINWLQHSKFIVHSCLLKW